MKAFNINIRCDRGILNVIKKSKMPFSGGLVLHTGLWVLKDIILNSR